MMIFRLYILTIALGVAALITSLIAAYYWHKSSIVPVQECESPASSVSDDPAGHILTTDVNLISIRLAWNESSRLNKLAARWTGLSALLGAPLRFPECFTDRTTKSARESVGGQAFPPRAAILPRALRRRATAAAGRAAYNRAAVIVASGVDPGAFRRQSNAPNCGLLGYLLRLGLVFVRYVELDRARRKLREVLVAVNRASRDIDELAGLHKTRLLSLDRVGDFAFLDGPPLIAGVAMKLVACARRNDDRLQAHHT
jgi:hypothetical protein